MLFKCLPSNGPLFKYQAADPTRYSSRYWRRYSQVSLFKFPNSRSSLSVPVKNLLKCSQTLFVQFVRSTRNDEWDTYTWSHRNLDISLKITGTSFIFLIRTRLALIKIGRIAILNCTPDFKALKFWKSRLYIHRLTKDFTFSHLQNLPIDKF